MKRLKKTSIDLAANVKLISTEGYHFLLGRMHFIGDDGFQSWLSDIAVMLNSGTFDNSKKVTNWISTGVSSEKLKPFDTNLAQT